MAYISLKFYKHVHNIHLEGTVSQILYLRLSFDFMLKKREELVDFFKHNFLHLTKQKLKPKSKILVLSMSV